MAITKDESIKQLEIIYDVLNGCGHDATKIYDEGYGAFYNYSGRGMYGAECVGVTVDLYSFSEVTKVLQKKNIGYSADNMGLDYVVYFQQIPYAHVKEICKG